MTVRFVLVAAALLQVGLLVRAELPRLVSIPANLALFTAEPVPPAANAPIRAFRELPELVRQIPRTAPTLVVTPHNEPISYELFTAPRPLALLIAFPPELLAKTVAAVPRYAWLLRLRWRQLHERGLALTQARLAEELERAEYVILFAAAALDPRWRPPAPAWREVARAGGSVLYARKR